jgi:(1->4)-alpha-D-glucan 1-alpha-D-glucosylmutase
VRATYRLQLGPELTLTGARALVPYLRRLGVSHLYLSPVWEARPGSAHGYDVIDPSRVSEALGGEGALRALAAEGLALLLDVVPNHQAASEDNPSWRDPARRAVVFDLDPAGGHRRFFDVDDLAGVRVEDPEVFASTHGAVLRLVREGVAEGLRIDHPDGLADPAGYLRRLREGGAGRVWVEKILEDGEPLRDWPVEGTTGYEFMNLLQRAFVDPAGEAAITALWEEVGGDPRPYAEVAAEAKLEQARTTFAPEVARLGREWEREAGSPPPWDLAAAVAALPVYRTYVEPWSGRVAPEDRAALEAADLPDGLRRVLLLEERGHDAFVTRFQQTSGAVMAKGVEDTAFYRYLRLLALNEVGGDPGHFSVPVESLHAANLERAARFPRALLATSTHDTKRSADVRARLGALAEMADEWAAAVRRWRGLAAPLRRGGAPDGHEEYLVFQTVVGAWPISADRLEAYVLKAIREAKRTTAWVDGDPEWEEAVLAYCRGLLASPAVAADIGAFAEHAAVAGARAALGQLAVKLTAPGVPDLYQGDESWDLSLVDPDNRRPVDWDARRRVLEGLRDGAPPTAGSAKIALVARTLALRARRPGAFAGGYLPLEAGADACAYARGAEVLVAVPLRARPVAGPVEVPPELRGRWRHVVTGAAVEVGARAPLGDLRAGFPVAVLERG